MRIAIICVQWCVHNSTVYICILYTQSNQINPPSAFLFAELRVYGTWLPALLALNKSLAISNYGEFTIGLVRVETSKNGSTWNLEPHPKFTCFPLMRQRIIQNTVFWDMSSHACNQFGRVQYPASTYSQKELRSFIPDPTLCQRKGMIVIFLHVNLMKNPKFWLFWGTEKMIFQCFS